MDAFDAFLTGACGALLLAPAAALGVHMRKRKADRRDDALARSMTRLEESEGTADDFADAMAAAARLERSGELDAALAVYDRLLPVSDGDRAAYVQKHADRVRAMIEGTQ
ncbi:MAG: hypothetical protein KJZ69_09595 [Phycisphaerales bacterium]|nr:hypothetical protein [Phycisphaerales bacterium]